MSHPMLAAFFQKQRAEATESTTRLRTELVCGFPPDLKSYREEIPPGELCLAAHENTLKQVQKFQASIAKKLSMLCCSVVFGVWAPLLMLLTLLDLYLQSCALRREDKYRHLNYTDENFETDVSGELFVHFSPGTFHWICRLASIGVAAFTFVDFQFDLGPIIFLSSVYLIETILVTVIHAHIDHTYTGFIQLMLGGGPRDSSASASVELAVESLGEPSQPDLELKLDGPPCPPPLDDDPSPVQTNPGSSVPRIADPEELESKSGGWWCGGCSRQ